MTQTMATGIRMQSNTSSTVKGGLDAGNTDTCFVACLNGQQHSVIIPSTVVHLTNDKLATVGEAIVDESHIQGDITPWEQYKQSIVIEYQGEKYLVGYAAMVQDGRLATTGNGDKSRYSSLEQLIRFLAASALATPLDTFEVDFVTTVPLRYYNKELRKAVTGALSGDFTFKMNGAEKHIISHARKVLVEGSPAFIVAGADTVDEDRVLIDVGGGTSDFLFFHGRNAVVNICKSEVIGVETIADYVADQIFEKHHGRILGVRERSDILRAFGSRDIPTSQAKYPKLGGGGYIIQNYELHALCVAGTEILAEEVLKAAAKLWGTQNGVVAGDVPNAYLMGGGRHFISSILRGTEEHPGKMPHIVPLEKSEYINALGCAEQAKWL